MSNKMKNSKTRYYEEDEETVDMRKENHRRRPHKNLVRFWEQHQEDYDEIDDFFYRK